MARAIAAQQKASLAKPLITMFANNTSQVFLWVGLGVDLAAMIYGQGAWAIFGLGMIFVWVASMLQRRVLRKNKKQGVTGAKLLLSRLLFGSLILGGIGNGIDLGIMGFVAHVSWALRDWQLTGIAVVVYLFFMMLPYIGRAFAPSLPLPLGASRFTIWRAILFSPDREYKDTRWKFATGMSVRVAVQAGAAYFALHDHVRPMGERTLILLSLVMLTFTLGFWWQQKGKDPAAEALAGFALYGLNFVVTLVLGWAFVAAQH